MQCHPSLQCDWMLGPVGLRHTSQSPGGAQMPACSLVKSLVCPFRLQSQSKQGDPSKCILAPMPSVFAFCKLTGVSPDQAVSVTLLGKGR